MNLDDARDNIGRRVKYTRFDGRPPEFGFITEVRGRMVFVRYGSDPISKATFADDLELT